MCVESQAETPGKYAMRVLTSHHYHITHSHREGSLVTYSLLCFCMRVYGSSPCGFFFRVFNLGDAWRGRETAKMRFMFGSNVFFSCLEILVFVVFSIMETGEDFDFCARTWHDAWPASCSYCEMPVPAFGHRQ